MLRNHNHRTRDYLRSDRIVRRKRRKFTFRLTIFALLVVLFMSVAFFVVRLEAFAIKTIAVEGNIEVSTSELVTIAEGYANSSWLYVFPRKNILLYPVDKLEEDIKSKYQRFSHVEVHRVGFSSLAIQVIERQPKALWCDENSTC